MQCMQCIILGMQIKADIRLTPCLYQLLLSSRWFLRGSTVYIGSGTHKRPSRTWNCVLLAPVRPNSIFKIASASVPPVGVRRTASRVVLCLLLFTNFISGGIHVTQIYSWVVYTWVSSTQSELVEINTFERYVWPSFLHVEIFKSWMEM